MQCYDVCYAVLFCAVPCRAVLCCVVCCAELPNVVFMLTGLVRRLRARGGVMVSFMWLDGEVTSGIYYFSLLSLSFFVLLCSSSCHILNRQPSSIHTFQHTHSFHSVCNLLTLFIVQYSHHRYSHMAPSLPTIKRNHSRLL